MSIRIQCITVDSRNPQELARFWAAALDWRVTYEDDEEYVIEPPEDEPGADAIPDILFGKNDDAKTVKNRWHLDLRPSDDQTTEVKRLMRLGARQVDIGQTGDESWVVMTDPEGNEFCVLQTLESDEDEDEDL